jgi:hypothetical protein
MSEEKQSGTASLRNCFLSELDVLWKDHGFTRFSSSSDGDRYDRPSTLGMQSIAISFLKTKTRTGLILLPPYVSLRIDAVEEIIARFEEDHPLRDAASIQQRSTIGVRLKDHSLLKLLGLRWVIWDDSSCAKVSVQFSKEVLTAAMSIWKKYDSLQAIVENLGKGSTFIQAERAVALNSLLHGKNEALSLGRRLLSSSSNQSAAELGPWLERFSANTL